MKKTSHKGYVLLLTLTIISLMVYLTNYIAYRSFSTIPQTKILTERKQARELAFSGIACAQRQLMILPTQEEDQQKESSEDTDKRLLKILLTHLNTWQEILLTQDIHGIDGKIRIHISCENGKMNINSLFDLLNKMPNIPTKGEQVSTSPNYKEILQRLVQTTEINMNMINNLLESLEQFFKAQQNALPLYDLSQLSSIKELQNFIINPSLDALALHDTDDAHLNLYDLFTVWTDNTTIQPWLLTPTLKKFFGFASLSSEQFASEEGQTLLDSLVNNFTSAASWNKDWNAQLYPLYKKKNTELNPMVLSLFAQKFAPTIFSVLSYGTVGKVTVRLLCILERVTKEQNEAPMEHSILIKKLYIL